MTAKAPGVALAYEAALVAYLDGEGEAALERAAELARRALAEDATGVEDLNTIDHAVLREANDRLHRARVELADARRATALAKQDLEALGYSVAHDLRAPLRGIDGFSLALEEDCGDGLPPDGRRFIALIRAATAQMSQLIDDLLRLSRISLAEVRWQEVDVTQLLEKAAKELALADPHRTVDVRIAKGMTAHGDTELLRLAFGNLLGNAWKFTSAHADARIDCTVSEDDGRKVFTVADNGVGFDPLYSSRLFQPFQRLHPARQFDGTGIGLAIVQRIALRLGGQVWAEGMVDRGARFHLALGSRVET